MEAPALQIDRREERYIEAVMLLSLMIGIVHLAMALLNLDVVVTAFLSEPVLSGFTTASALLICTSQLKHLLGMVIPRGTFLHTLLYAAEHWREVQLLALAFGLGGVLLLELSKVANKRYCPSVNPARAAAPPRRRRAPRGNAAGGDGRRDRLSSAPRGRGARGPSYTEGAAAV